MKYYTVLLLVTGLNIVHSISILNETVLMKESEKEIIKDENSYNKSEENGDIFNTITDLSDKQPNYEEPLDIVMENIKNPSDQFNLEEPANDYDFSLQDPSDATFDEIIPPRDADYYYNDVINRDPNELMDTAAGFVPIPIFKRRQKPRKQVAARRRFRKPYLYRRLYYFYPYYNYYRPSSLRYYY